MNQHASTRLAGTAIAACLTASRQAEYKQRDAVRPDRHVDHLRDQPAHARRRLAGSGAVAMTSGALNASRWGLRGREDLGGRTAAVFTLENGFSGHHRRTVAERRRPVRPPGMDRPELENGRHAHVRPPVRPDLDFVTPLGASGRLGGNAVHPYDNDDSNRNLRINHAVKYTARRTAG